MAATGIGWGKAILFGEHFVVYGLAGIAASIELNTKCVFKKNADGIISNDLVTGEKIKFGQDRSKRLDEVLGIIFRELAISGGNFNLELSTNMSVRGGMGSSAALAVSISRCLDKEFGLGVSDEKVNEIAYKVEKLFHSNPSGIDNTVSTYGGLLWFVRGGSGNLVERIALKNPVEAVLVDTGIIRDTGEAVDFVKRQKEQKPEEFGKIFSEYEQIARQAKKEISEQNWASVGELMDKNQELLRRINVSSPELEQIISTCKKAGALGAKLTGAGLGGNAIALASGKKMQGKIAQECEKKGYKAYKIMIGMKS